jgi:hypothetical protein
MKLHSLLGVMVGVGLPTVAWAQVDPSRVFYAVAFTHGSPHNGVITAQSLASPFGIVATGPRGTANGAITFDPVRPLLYAGQCCVANQPLQAIDPTTLARVTARDIPLMHSGSMAIEVDGPRRVLFHYDTVTRVLRAISLADANYGTVVASTTLTALPAEPTPTSIGDQIAVDTRAQRVVVTGGDGGPVLLVDVSSITATLGDFGPVVNTGHVNRSVGNSGGAVAVDEAGRRIFFIPTTGTVRVVGADAPFARIADIVIPSMQPNDCGLHFDGRTGNLYVGRGTSMSPVVVAFPSMSVTTFSTGAGDVPALSFASPGVACVDRDGDGAPNAACAPPGARADCDDARADVHPSAMEVCDTRDNDCDGLIDEGFCRVEGMCVPHDALNPRNACQRCEAPSDQSAATAWSNRPAMTVCRPAAGACDLPELCDGTGAPCPDDRLASADQVCRRSSSVEACDPSERCTGVSALCPNDRVIRSPTEETCNGVDDDCDGMVDEPPCVPMPDAGPDALDGAADLVPDVPRDVSQDTSMGVEMPTLDVTNEGSGLLPPPRDAMSEGDGMAAPDVSPMDPPPDATAASDVPPVPDATAASDVPPVPDARAANEGGADAGGFAMQGGGCGCNTPGRSRGTARWVFAVAVFLATVKSRSRSKRRGGC